MGSQRVGHDWVTKFFFFCCTLLRSLLNMSVYYIASNKMRIKYRTAKCELLELKCIYYNNMCIVVLQWLLSGWKDHHNSKHKGYCDSVWRDDSSYSPGTESQCPALYHASPEECLGKHTVYFHSHIAIIIGSPQFLQFSILLHIY